MKRIAFGTLVGGDGKPGCFFTVDRIDPKEDRPSVIEDGVAVLRYRVRMISHLSGGGFVDQAVLPQEDVFKWLEDRADY